MNHHHLLARVVLSLALLGTAAACGDDSSSSSSNGDSNTTASNGTSNSTTASNGTSNTVVDCSSPTNTSTEASPTRIQLGESISDGLCPGDTHYYVINIDAGFQAVLRMEHDTANGVPDFVEYPDSNVDDPITAAHDWVTSARVLSYVAEQNGDFAFAVTGPSGQSSGPISYTLLAGESCLLDGDCGAGLFCDRRTLSCGTYAEPECGRDEDLDPNGSFGDAEALDLTIPGGEMRASVDLEDRVSCASDDDWFAMDIEDTDSLSVRATPDGITHLFGVFLINSTGQVVGQNLRKPLRAGTAVSVNASHLPGGRYYALVMSDPEEGATGDMGYTFETTLNRIGPCSDNFNCSAPRPFCQGGLCVGLEGNGSVELAGQCDSIDDCVPKADVCFTEPANPQSWFCTVECTTDDACASFDGMFGPGYCYIDHPEDGTCAEAG
ncbi:MAG: hypothetical protein AAFS10_09475, partial [Myxococcota bacterium]